MKSKTQYVNIECTVNEIYAITKVTQNIINPFNKPVEIEVELPIIESNQLIKFTATIDKKKVVSKISSKEKAKEKYTDSIASGNIGIYSMKSEENETQIVNIGNLQKKQNAILESEFVQMISSEDMSCQFLLLQHYPKFIFKESSNNQNSTCTFNAVINLTVQGKLTRLVINKNDFPGDVTKKYDKNYSNVEISIHNKSFVPTKQSSKTMQILFRSNSINKPKLYSQYNPTFDETSYLLSYLYSSGKVKIPILPHIDEDTVINYTLNYQQDIINNYPGLFIFLVDQSGSMSGSPIKIVSNALKIFFQSLPRNSYFQLIGFGSSFKKYTKTPLQYTSENVAKIMKIIDDLNADLGGTNLINPLRNILVDCINNYKDINLQKSIFVLTDGDIFDKSECFQLIEQNLHDFKIHSIGIGGDFDSDLIKQLGKKGNGSSHFVPYTKKINKVIIEILNECIRDYLIKGNFDMGNEFKIEYDYPKENKFICQDDIITYAFICKGKSNIHKTKILFSATNPKSNKSINEEIEIENIDELKEGDIISKIVIGKYVNGNIDEDEEIKLAKKYQVLSKNTALSGEIINENDNSSKEIDSFELIKPKKTKHMSDPVEEYIEPQKEGFLYEIGNFFKNMFRSSERIPMKIDQDIKCSDMQMDLLPNICCCGCEPIDCKMPPQPPCFDDFEPQLKQCSYESDKPVQKISENNFQNLMLSQDAIDGFWDDNAETKKIADELKEVYEKIRMLVEKENLKKDIQEKVIFTFIVLYYVLEQNKEKIEDVKLILNKGKEFLEMNNFQYESLVEKIN